MDFSKACRCCLAKGQEMRNINDIVHIEKKLTTISNIIVNCLNVEISRENEYPQNICYSCIGQLQTAYCLKANIEKARKALEIALKKNKEGRFYCLQCNSNFISYLLLKAHCLENHQVIGAPKGKYTCKCCCERFNKLIPALKHRKRHIVPNSCPWCLAQITDYDTHIQSCIKYSEYKTSDKREITPCHHCGKSYPREYLPIHLRTHGPDLWNCPECGRGFKVKGNLATHMKIMHSEERPHKCPYCDQCFKLAGHRNKHVRCKHLKERNKQCVECGKAFFSALCLRRHMYVHTGEKIHKCQFCDKAYQKRWGLKMHQKSQHSEELNYC